MRKATGTAGNWRVTAFEDGGYIFYHACSRKKHMRYLHRPAFASKHESTYQTVHCLRCKEETPSILVLAAKTGQLDVIHGMNIPETGPSGTNSTLCGEPIHYPCQMKQGHGGPHDPIGELQ